MLPIPLAERSKEWVYGCSSAETVGSNPAGAWLPVLNVVCCQVEVSASEWSLIQRSRTECGVSEYDREVSMRRPWPTRAVQPWEKNNC
jgi:hypothetical protein